MFSNKLIPILYHPKDSRKQNMLINIPGTSRQEILVLNDIVHVSIEEAEIAIKTSDWQLGYSMTVHSSQGLTISNPKTVFILDDYLNWSNLAYLAVSRVEYMSQLQLVRIAIQKTESCPITDDELRKVIIKKLKSYSQVDKSKNVSFSLKVNDILLLKATQNNECASCSINLLWQYEPGDTQQFSVDRIDNTLGHTQDNVRLTCLECNRNRGMAPIN